MNTVSSATLAKDTLTKGAHVPYLNLKGVSAALSRSDDVSLSTYDARSDQVAAAARDRILHQPHLAAQRIWCELNEQTLFLYGQVPSFYIKQLAQAAVAGLDGVDQVVNEIEVLW